MTTILACGSRGWDDRTTIVDALRSFAPRGPVTVITGGARGADSLAHSAALELGFETKVFPADWNAHGKRAGFLRNLQMLDERPDVVLAFSLGTKGTEHTTSEAIRRGIHTRIFSPDDASAAQKGKPDA